MQVLGISGSLRQGSFNTALLRAAIEMAPQDMTIETGRIDDLPLYNDDVRVAGYPPTVVRLREQVARADAILLVTPEYNYSVPGVLKNAIDWVSRPPDQPFNEKPIALMGASIGMLGSARSQYHLRQCFVYLNAFVLNQPEVMVAKAPERFDAAGKLTDESTRKIVAKQLQALVEFTAWVKKKRG